MTKKQNSKPSLPTANAKGKAKAETKTLLAAHLRPLTPSTRLVHCAFRLLHIVGIIFSLGTGWCALACLPRRYALVGT